MALQLPEILHGLLYSAVAATLLIWPGNAICRWLLDITRLTPAMEAKKALAKAVADAQTASAGLPPTPEAPSVGGVIGGFERSLIALGIITGSWEVLAGVVALKTVARFKELDERLDAEYFLVGSLASIAWATAVAALWITWDQTFGYHLSVGLAEVANALRGD